MIIKAYDIFEGIQRTLAMLDVDEAPESQGYLESLMIDDELTEDDPYVIASTLVECDLPEPLPEALRDFIEELYMDANIDGNPDALSDLGSLYYEGSRGFDQDFAKAVEYYQAAANHGSRQAQENLGYCYYYGRNMPVDYEKAFQYFALGAFDGHIISIYKIGDMYLNGYYVEKNPTEAFHIYEHCLEIMTDETAERCAGPIYLRVGKAFLYGNGTEENPKNALICFQKAESFLYDMVADGDVMYKKSLQEAVEGQAKARAKLNDELPEDEWEFN